MDYKEAIKIAIKTAHDNLEADRKLRDDALTAFKKREEEEEHPIKLLIGQYLDEELKDCNGCSIKEGHFISNQRGFPVYKVLKRGMQFVFGIPLFNPSVDVVVYNVSSGIYSSGKKPKQFHKSELSEMEILPITKKK